MRKRKHGFFLGAFLVVICGIRSLLQAQAPLRASSTTSKLETEEDGFKIDDFYPSRIYSSKKDISVTLARSSSPLIAIAMVTLLPNPHQDTHPFYRFTRALQAEYAKRHGYDFYALKRPLSPPKNTTRTLHYQKILSSQRLFQVPHPVYRGRNYDWIFWIDADAVITNLSVKLEDLMQQSPPNKHVVLSGDTNIVSIAQVFWRNTKRSNEIQQKIWDMYQEDKDNTLVPNYENGMLASMVGGCHPRDSLQRKKDCYDSVDFWGKDRRIVSEIKAGNISSVPVALWARQEMHWLPKRSLNSTFNDWEKGVFILHAVLKKKGPLVLKYFKKSLEFHEINAEDLLSDHNFTQDLLT